ncbi:MAG TPA: 16S rRNA (adenine(1518)-N(6)/adenine(1519)-N(6))-dimethyltransferase RsmA [Candidatus Acidoferrales bacterium]|nr:16S rRNA (adenine(1518)-N(6)/adenine(1519)-N(6))-dimethyltransferase RsmA [Candidatus Acidoferrales bacterium]
MTPRKLGQHFLTDAGWRTRILELLRPAPGQVWVEIGAGRGEMTAELARRVERVVAIELDRSLLAPLGERTAELPVEIVSGDVLALDIGRLGGRRFHVYGSLPYYITSPILRRLFALADRIEEIDVVVQWEVAQRIVAAPGRREYGWLSVLARFYTKPEILLRVPPGAFRPAPKVDSALVALRPPGEKAGLGIEEEQGFLAFCEACFAHKRKTLVNNLKAGYSAEAVREALAAERLGPKARAEEMSVAELAGLYRRIGAGV